MVTTHNILSVPPVTQMQIMILTVTATVTVTSTDTVTATVTSSPQEGTSPSDLDTYFKKFGWPVGGATLVDEVPISGKICTIIRTSSQQLHHARETKLL